MTDLTQLVADALFQTEDTLDYALSRGDCETLARTALQTVRAQGWRIVKPGTEFVRKDGSTTVEIDGEWTG